MSYYMLVIVFVFIINLFIWLYIHAHNNSNPINRAYLAYLSTLQMWLVVKFIICNTKRLKNTLVLLKIGNLFWIPLGFCFIYFIFTLLRKEKNVFYWCYKFSIVGIIIVNLSTNFLVDNFKIAKYGIVVKPGFSMPYVILYTNIIPFAYCLFLILQAIKESCNFYYKKQLMLITYSTSILLTLETIFLFIVPLTFNKWFSLQGSFLIIAIHCWMMFLAIVKYKFLSIRIEDAYIDLFNNINEGIVLLDESGNVIEMNEIARELFNIKDQKLVSFDIKNFIKDYNFNQEYKSYETKIQCQSNGKVGIRDKGFDEEATKYVLISQSRVKKNSNIELGKILIINDITGHVLANHEKESFRYLSITDALTGLYNHRYFYDYLKQELDKENNNVSILFCDIDRFKQVNDSYGHVIGDMILRESAAIIKEEVGESGLVFRYGGEEFIVLLNECQANKALEIAEKIRERIKSSIVLQEEKQGVPVTISIGVACYPVNASNIEELVVKADKAMYYSKQNGRNQCNIYDNELERILESKKDEAAKKELLIDSVYSLAKAIDVKDYYTGMHSEMVAKYTLLLADKLGLSEKEQEDLKIGALLHDCGKIGVPDNIINKQGKLSEEEFDIVKNHTILGSEIASNIIKTKEIKACIRNHHERWDGKGYPDKLKGENIPKYARIVCIADAYHAMTSDRPYRKGLTREEAFHQLIINKGVQFDSGLVDEFIEAIKNNHDMKVFN